MIGQQNKEQEMMCNNSDIRQEAQNIALSNKEMDSGTHIIKFFSKEKDTSIKLLEVSSNVATSGTVEPFSFSEEEGGISYPVSMILLSDQEWQDVQDGKLSLPKDWGNVSSGEDLL